MTSQLESLPPEILEQIISQNERNRGTLRSTRLVSRTLREATQRQYQQLCQRRISIKELREYLNQGPEQIALFPTPQSIRDYLLSKSYDAYRIKLYRWNNYQYGQSDGYLPLYEPYYVYLSVDNMMGENTEIEITERYSHIDDSPAIAEQIVTSTTILRTAITQTLDLLTQWRILIRRFGCVRPNSPDKSVDEFARDYLHRHFDE
jgi:hypothetical protein